MSMRTLVAAAAFVAAGGSADAQVIYSGGGFYGTPPGFYGSGYSVPGAVPGVTYSGGFNAPGYYSGVNRGVIYAGSPVTPLYNSFSAYPGYNTGVYNSYTSGFGLSNRGLGYSYNNFGTGYPGVYNAGVYSPGYVSGFNVITTPVVRSGFYSGFRRR